MAPCYLNRQSPWLGGGLLLPSAGFAYARPQVFADDKTPFNLTIGDKPSMSVP